MTRLRWFILILNFFLVIGLFFLLKARHLAGSASDLPVYGQVPDFALTERSGSRVSLSNLKNRVWVADFIFTRCAAQCPLMSQKVGQFQRELKDVRFVSFSVDPGTDTPQVLSDYSKLYGADPARWFFLTGDKETLNRVFQSFHVATLGDPMFHSVSFVLVDRAGRIRGYYDSGDPARVSDLVADARRLAGER